MDYLIIFITKHIDHNQNKPIKMTKNTTIVYLSALLPDRYPDFTINLKKILTDEGIAVEFLSGTKDIWCRDYMPVQLTYNRFVQFLYQPDYLVGYDERRTNPGDVLPRIDADVFHSQLVIDGGNVVRYGRTAILTDKIFDENPIFKKQKPALIQQLAVELDVDKVVIIPVDASDISGHADGMVRFVAEDTVIINDYLESDGYSRSFITESLRLLETQGIRVAGALPYRAFKRKNRDGDYTAIGCYINYLDCGTLIIFPTFGIAEDNDASLKIQQYFPLKRIVQLDCRDIAEGGGVLNCITLNL
jgi:agmatine deiminase